MVLEFYNLREQPFGVTPDPRYLYLSPTHREATASLEYGISSGRGFLGLIAPAGMGKTTILFHLLQRLAENARTVFIFQTHVSPRDFLGSVMTDLGLHDCGGDLLAMQSKLNEMLLDEAKSGRRVVIVIDEAQNLEDPVLEHLRMLSNFETTSEKLIQIVLAGQTQLAEKLASPSLVQLRQRISMIARLAPFDKEDTERYINHRLEVAGYNCKVPMFTRQAFRLIAEASGGIPRNINNICFNALSLGSVNQQRTIPTQTMREVIEDLDLATVKKLPSPAVAMPVNQALSLSSQLPSKAKTAIRSWGARFAVAGLILAAAVVEIALLEWSNRNHFRTQQNPISKTESVNVPAEPATSPANATRASEPFNTVPTPMISGATQVELPVAASQLVPVRSPDELISIRSVRVGQDQTLYYIAMKNLGAFNKESVKAIQELNPWMTNPDHIRAGQTIRIPETVKKQGQTKTDTESTAEVGKP
jgi:type II secretory pathway predicted ATPase ExeA